MKKYDPLLGLARQAKKMRMDMQCDPQWVIDALAERDALRDEADQLRKDAERYRCFRRMGLPNGLGVYDEELDAALDNEISEEAIHAPL